MKQICGDCLHYYACAAWNIGSLANTEAGSCVNYTPAADVVEVVRCKDCRYCMAFRDKSGGHYGHCRIWITRTISDYSALVDADGYCSYAERKEAKETQK